jgi:hypothetical protein
MFTALANSALYLAIGGRAGAIVRRPAKLGRTESENRTAQAGKPVLPVAASDVFGIRWGVMASEIPSQNAVRALLAQFEQICAQHLSLAYVWPKKIQPHTHDCFWRLARLWRL